MPQHRLSQHLAHCHSMLPDLTWQAKYPLEVLCLVGHGLNNLMVVNFLMVVLVVVVGENYVRERYTWRYPWELWEVFTHKQMLESMEEIQEWSKFILLYSLRIDRIMKQSWRWVPAAPTRSVSSKLQRFNHLRISGWFVRTTYQFLHQWEKLLEWLCLSESKYLDKWHLMGYQNTNVM